MTQNKGRIYQIDISFFDNVMLYNRMISLEKFLIKFKGILAVYRL